MNIIERNFYRLLRSGALGTDEEIEPLSVWKWNRLFQYSQMHDVTTGVTENEIAKWWSLGEITALLATRYPNFDPETTFKKIGNALNDIQFNFKSKRTTKHMEYWLIEKE